jgi:hypothetical protein
MKHMVFLARIRRSGSKNKYGFTHEFRSPLDRAIAIREVHKSDPGAVLLETRERLQAEMEALLPEEFEDEEDELE